jgi:putative transcriptional regulator
MSVQHHPDDTLLVAYSAGGLDEAMALILGSHLSYCAQCNASVALGEHIGGILLDELAPVPLATDALAKTLARLDIKTAPKIAPTSNDNTPPPLRAVLGRDLSEVRWRKMGPRLGYVTLYRRGPVAMRLLRGAPGTDVGLHTHRGMEYTLVLRGGFTDETGTYGPGDFQIASPDTKHNPVADTDGDCINLAVTTASLEFEGILQKFVGRMFGF